MKTRQSKRKPRLIKTDKDLESCIKTLRFDKTTQISPRTGGVQYAFFGPAGRRMDVIFSDADSRPLVNRDAQGMVMFSWTQPAGP